MKILVCLKQVPDGKTRLVPRPQAPGLVDEDGISFAPNEFDQFGLEAALQFKDADASCEVVVACIGPERAKTAISNALAMGADRAIHLKDDAFQGGDPWSCSLALAAIARAEGPFDLVFAGLQASDDNFGQTGPLLAERLGVPCATGIMAWRLEGSALVVERELEAERREIVKLPLPCVVTFQTGSGEKAPRYPSIKGIMAAKKKEQKVRSPQDLGLSPEDVGMRGRRLVVEDIAEPPKQAGAEMLTGGPAEVARELVRRIRARGIA
jgi:electron transfer flavoprotein beta subunit